LEPEIFRWDDAAMKRIRKRCLSLCAAAFLAAPPGLLAADTTQSQPASAWEQSVSLEGQGDYKAALSKLDEYAGQSGDPYLVQLRSGWLYYRMGSYEHAAQYYQAASLLAPESVAPLMGLAWSARMLGQTERAATACQKVLGIDPANYAAGMMLAEIYFARRNYAMASQVYSTIEKNYPEDSAALSEGSWALLDSGRKQDAAAGFRRLLQMYPSYPNAGQGYQMSGSQKVFLGGLQ
jgi:tetratricopeptide (TPR) repeat protein